MKLMAVRKGQTQIPVLERIGIRGGGGKRFDFNQKQLVMLWYFLRKHSVIVLFGYCTLANGSLKRPQKFVLACLLIAARTGLCHGGSVLLRKARKVNQKKPQKPM